MNKEEQKLRGFEPIIYTSSNIHNDTQLEELTKQLEKHIIEGYAPESTRLRRNYTACAEWFFLWSEKNKRDDQNHAFLLTTPAIRNSCYSRFYKKYFNTKDFEKEYECKFIMQDDLPFEESKS